MTDTIDSRDAEIARLSADPDPIAIATRCRLVLDALDLNKKQHREVARRAARLTTGDHALMIATHCMVVLGDITPTLSPAQRDEVTRRVAMVHQRERRAAVTTTCN